MSAMIGDPTTNSMCAVNWARSSDVWEHAQHLSGWAIEYAQLSPGRFEGTLTHIQLGHMQIIRDQVSTSLLKRGQALPDTVVFSVPLHAGGDGRYVGQPLSPPSCLLNNGNDLPELCTPFALDLICVAVNRGWLIDQALAMGYDFAARRLLLVSRRITLAESAMQKLRAYFVAMFADVEGLSAALVHVNARRMLENSLAETLLSTLCCDEELAEKGQFFVTPYKRIADKARAFMLAGQGQQPTIPDICTHLGISRRKLQNCFHEAYGFSPHHFLRVLRLNAVKAELRQASGPVSIGDVAARWGFWHWSRFAGDYRDHFGELPSQTLRRLRP